MSESASFSPGLLYISTVGGTKCVDQLVGKSFCTVSAGKREVVAACKDGAFGVSVDGDVDSVCSMKLKSVVQGSGFYVAVDTEHTLYSWGTNCCNGQLGQGACHQTVLAPAQIVHSAKFVAASCGDSHAMALDDTGGAYAWGENTDRQLGLYTKTKPEMHLSNSVIENLSFVPRLIPLSLSHSVTKVACGFNFSLVITKGGIVYSWGAGECGQLGTGRCTKREVPAPIMLIDSAGATAEGSEGKGEDSSPVSVVVPLLVRDVACGTSHVVAASEDGKLYAWGLNKSNQLGLDSFRTQHYPITVPVLLSRVRDPNIDPNSDSSSTTSSATEVMAANTSIVRVYAHGHSSAAIDADGRLFTWGCTAHDRLMHVLPLQLPAPPQDLSLTYAELRTKRMACARGNIGHFKASKAQAMIDAAAEKAAQRLPISTIARPTFVQTRDLHGCAIESFAFATSHSVALVLTCLKKAWPTEGPRRSFSKLQLHGDGFWDSPNIIVKFTFVRSNWSTQLTTTAATAAQKNDSRPSTSRLPAEPTFNPPRSCSGSFVDSGSIVCKPPKFSECGVYSVAVSMDGAHFLPQTVEIFVHHELSVQKQSPELCDVSGTSKLSTMELHVGGLPTPPLGWAGEYSVRLQFTCIEGTASLANMSAGSSFSHSISASTKTGGAGGSKASAALPADDYHIITVARLVAPPNTAPSTRPTSPGSQQDTDNEDGEGSACVSAHPEEPALSVLVCSDVDLSEFKRRAGNTLYQLRCQVSLNGQDFSSLKPPSHTGHRQRSSGHGHSEAGAEGIMDAVVKTLPVTLLYSVNPVSAEPSCASIDRFCSVHPVEMTESDAVNEATPQAAVAAGSIDDTPAMEVVVKGSSLIPLYRLPKGSQVDAMLTPSLLDIEWQDGFTPKWSNAEALQALLPLAVCPVRCEHTTSLTISIGPVAESALRACIGWINAVAGGAPLPESTEQAQSAPMETHQCIDSLSLNISFVMHVGDQVIPLAKQMDPVTLKLYRNKPVELVPSCCNALLESPLECTLLVKRVATAAELQQELSFPAGLCADGFAFYSAEAVVAVHIPLPSSSTSATGDEDGTGEASQQVQYLPPVILQSNEYKLLSLPLLPLNANGNADANADGNAVAVDSSEQDNEDISKVVPAAAQQDQEAAAGANPSTGEGGGIAVEENKKVDGAIHPVTKHIMQIQLPPASRWLDVLRNALGDAAAAEVTVSALPHVCVSCWLDGKSMPSQDTWAKLIFYQHLTAEYVINPAAPKTGFVPENTITIDLASYCPTPLAVHPTILNACASAVEDQISNNNNNNSSVISSARRTADGDVDTGFVSSAIGGVEDVRPIIPQQCVVRIRGAPTDEFPEGCCVDVAGVLIPCAADPSKSSIVFDIPERVKTEQGMMPVQKTPKDKTMYFIDLSVDGGMTFDTAAAPLLFLK